MARIDPYTDIEEGEIIESPKEIPQQPRADSPWRRSDRWMSPAREAKLRAEPYPPSPSYTKSRSPGPVPDPKGQEPENTPQTAQELKIQLDQFIFKWNQKQRTEKEVPMRADGYARAVARLEKFPVWRKVGNGTLEDPEVCSITYYTQSLTAN